jgi:hypothetical protein
VLEEIDTVCKIGVTGRSKYDNYLAGSGRDCGLYVGNRQLYYGDVLGACRRPPKVERASLDLEGETR